MAVVKCPSCGHPVTVPDKKTGLWWGLGCLIAVPALLTVVAVVGLLAAIAIPSFMKARESSQRNACLNNLSRIESAKKSAALEHNYKAGDPIPEQAVAPFLKNGCAGLVCPRGGHYTINPLGQEPECSVHGPLSALSAGRARLPKQAATPDVEPAPRPEP